MRELTITNGNDQFYPTPNELAGRMLAGVDWRYVRTILEPSAGKGNLALCAMKANHASVWHERAGINIDCIEIDPYLRQILKYELCGGRLEELEKRRCDLDMLRYSDLNDAEKSELQRLGLECERLNALKAYVVHDDFLTYEGYKRYDLILMNPPFAQGDRHLLKALELQSGGGRIICLLNAETLLNPYTNIRQLLKKKLDAYGAGVTFVKDGFKNAERRAKVDVAIVRVNIPRPVYKSTINERFEKAAKLDKPGCDEGREMVFYDLLEQSVQRFNVEVAATLEFVREYEAFRPYMTKDANGGDAILTLTVGTDRNCMQMVDLDEYMRLVRLKYWRELLDNESFTGQLTSNLVSKYRERIEDMANYDFSMFNIKTLQCEMYAELVDGIKSTILSLFDKLTHEHSWYPESKNNVHYFNGWKTNKAHKIGNKSIIPTHGMFSDYSWKKNTFEVSTAYGVISDIEKVFNYLDGGLTQEVDLLARLRTADLEGRTRNIECKYFKVDLYKKGTTHIKFTNLDLVEKLNIYAAQNKNWLPPNYGKAAYADMSAEEQEVIDSFQGESEYARVMSQSAYFLMEPTGSLALLAGGDS